MSHQPKENSRKVNSAALALDEPMYKEHVLVIFASLPHGWTISGARQALGKSRVNTS